MSTAPGGAGTGPAHTAVAVAAAGPMTLLRPEATPPPGRSVPTAATTRLAAPQDTTVVAIALAVLSNDRAAGRVQTGFTNSGRLSEPGDLLRQWIQLGTWNLPTGSAPGCRPLYRLGHVALLVLVWRGLRPLPSARPRHLPRPLARRRRRHHPGRGGERCPALAPLLSSPVKFCQVLSRQHRWAPAPLRLRRLRRAGGTRPRHPRRLRRHADRPDPRPPAAAGPPYISPTTFGCCS